MRKVREYTYECLPVGTRVYAKGGRWVTHRMNNQYGLIVPQYQNLMSTVWIEPENKQKIIAAGPYYANKEWPLYIPLEHCWKCKKEFYDEDTGWYLCQDCRIS